jgi:hypothetical protein
MLRAQQCQALPAAAWPNSGIPIERLWNISQHLMCTRKAAKGCDEKIFVAQCSYPVDFLSPGSGLTRSADPPLAVVPCDGKRQSDVPP